MNKIADRPIKAVYPVATSASTTAQGGTVLASSDITWLGHCSALVGDVVRYPDGSEARIISGAGTASVVQGRSMAVVGSELDNGDRITGPMHDGLVIVQYADQPPIPGLLDPTFTAPHGAAHG